MTGGKLESDMLSPFVANGQSLNARPCRALGVRGSIWRVPYRSRPKITTTARPTTAGLCKHDSLARMIRGAHLCDLVPGHHGRLTVASAGPKSERRLPCRRKSFY